MQTLRKRIEELEYRTVRQAEKYHAVEKECADLRKRLLSLEKKAAADENDYRRAD